MARFDVAIWRWVEDGWPQVITTQEAETAADAVLRVLQARGLHRAAKVAVNAGDGRMHRWYRVACLADGFVHQ